jgi:integrase
MEYRSKSDYLENFREYLIKSKIPKNTVKNYSTELKNAFLGQEFSNINEINIEKIEKHLKNIKSKKSANNLKIALKKFKELNNDFKYDEFYIDLESSKKSHIRLTKFKKPLYLASTMHKINALDNERFKMAYKLMLNGALRSDEAGNIKKEDINIKDNDIEINIKHGKGGFSRKIKLIDPKYFNENLAKYLKLFSAGENIFYSANYMQKKAKDLGFMCHDLRRASSQIVEKLNSDKDKEEAAEAVKKHLGHSLKTRTYKKYLSRKIIFEKTKWEGLNGSRQKIRSR